MTIRGEGALRMPSTKTARRFAFAALFGWAALSPSIGSAAEPARMPVEVRDSSQDPVGMRLVYQLREQILASRQFTAADTGIRFVVVLIAMAPDTRSQDRTAYSAAILFNEPGQRLAYITSSVGVCGANRVASCAEGILADIAAEVKSPIPMSSN